MSDGMSDDELRKAIRDVLVANDLIPAPEPEPPEPEPGPEPDLGFQPLVGITAAALRHKTFPPPIRIVEGLIPGGLTMLAGKPKIGKSFMVLDLAVAVASGGAFLGRQCQQGDVVYLALEDPDWRWFERLEMLRPDGDWPERLTLVPNMSSLERDGIKQLRHWIANQPAPRLIIIDVYTKVRRVTRDREQTYSGDYLAGEPVKKLADETGVAILCVHHQRKDTAGDDPLDSVSGSTGLTGVADTILVLDRKAAGVTLYARGRDIEEVEWAVEMDRDTGRWSNKGEAKEVRMSDIRRNILAALRDEGEPMGPTAVAIETGANAEHVRSTLGRMAKAGEIVKLKRGKYALASSPPATSATSATNDRVTEEDEAD